MNRAVGNVAVLDLRYLAEVTVKVSVGNAGVVLYDPRTFEGSDPRASIAVGNAGVWLEAPAEYELLRGTRVLNATDLSGAGEPLNAVVIGTLIVKNDVTERQITDSIGNLIVRGEVVCPETLVAAVKSKMRNRDAKIIAYAGNPEILTGRVTINERFLRTLKQSTSLLVVGRVQMVQPMDTTLLAERLLHLRVVGRVLIKEEYAVVLDASNDAGECNVEMVPAGYEYVDTPLALDELMVRRYSGRGLYAADRLLFTERVTPDLLRGHLRGIISEKVVICPDELRLPVLELCQDAAPLVLGYTGRLMLVEGDLRLAACDLDYTSGPLALVVCGTLAIDAGIPARVLFEKIGQIDNFGLIEADSGQCGALRARLRTADGQIEERDRTEEATDDTSGLAIGNVDYLKM